MYEATFSRLHYVTVIICTRLTLRLPQTLKKEPMHKMKLLFLLITPVHDFYQSGRDRGHKERDVWLKVTTVVNGRGGEDWRKMVGINN